MTGDDDLQVRTTQRITALPPFVLGVKVPRYLPNAGAIDPEIVALDAEGHEVAGLPMTVRLVHRQWNALLQASDFAQGSAKYETQVLDETVAERRITSGAAALPVHFDAPEAGVYIVELEAADKVGRRQIGEGGFVHGRRHAGDVVAPAGADRDGDRRQGIATRRARPPRW